MKLSRYHAFDCESCASCEGKGYHRVYNKEWMKYFREPCKICEGHGIVPKQGAKPIEMKRHAVLKSNS